MGRSGESNPVIGASDRTTLVAVIKIQIRAYLVIRGQQQSRIIQIAVAIIHSRVLRTDVVIVTPGELFASNCAGQPNSLHVIAVIVDYSVPSIHQLQTDTEAATDRHGSTYSKVVVRNGKRKE